MKNKELIRTLKFVIVSASAGIIELAVFTLMNEFTGLTPLNVRGEYWNQYFNYVIRYFNDFTEKGIVLLLD
jgi:putative flippase GtrA